MVNIKDIQVGDLFSEQAFYNVVKITPTSITFKHLTTGTEVDLGNDYTINSLNSAASYNNYLQMEVE